MRLVPGVRRLRSALHRRSPWGTGVRSTLNIAPRWLRLSGRSCCAWVTPKVAASEQELDLVDREERRTERCVMLAKDFRNGPCDLSPPHLREWPRPGIWLTIGAGFSAAGTQPGTVRICSAMTTMTRDRLTHRVGAAQPVIIRR